MNRTRTTLAALLITLVISTNPAVASSSPSVEASPASKRIASIERRLQLAPGDPDLLVELAIAFARRARETADPVYYDRADEALDAALQTEPGLAQARRARVSVLLGRHRFAAAAELAETMVGPDTRDPSILGQLFDAYVELGRYDEAWELLPRMLDAAPGAPAVLARASYIVELSGDLDGAASLMERALESTPGIEFEERAWCLTQLAHLDRQAGNFERARRRLIEALGLFPDYHYAVAEQARVATATGDAEAAARWATQRCEIAPHPECYYDLGVALERAGLFNRAKSAFERFEPAALAESESEDNANGELVRFYLRQVGDVREALRIASLERARRADVFTRTLHAAALAANGRYADALSEVDFVAEVGTVEPWVVETLTGIREQASIGVDSGETRQRGGFAERVAVRARADDLAGIAISASEGSTGRNDLRTRPILRTGDIVETVPGIIATQHSGGGKASQYYLRGFNLDHGTDLRIDVEGMPVNLPTHGHGQGYADLSFVIPELVDSVRFRKGSHHARVGDFGAAGSTDIHLIDDLEASRLQIARGGHGHARALTTGNTELGGGRVIGGFEYSQHDGPWSRPDDFRKWNAMARYLRGDRQRGWSLTAMGYDGSWSATDQIPERAVETTIDRFDLVDPELGGSSSRYSLSGEAHRIDARRSRRIGAFVVAYDLELLSNFTYCLGQGGADSCSIDADRIRQSDQRRIVGTSFEQSWRRPSNGRRIEWRVGGEMRYHDIDNGLSSARSDQPFAASIRRDRIEQIEGGFFAEIDVRWRGKLRTLAGARIDGISVDVHSELAANSGSRHASIASPKLAVVLGPWARTELYVNYGHGFHSNDARGIVASEDPATGQSVRPADPLVRAVGAEIGLRTTAIPGLQSTLSIFRTDLDSELLFVGDAGTNEPGPASRRVGVELTNFYRVTPWISFDLDLTWTDAELRGVHESAARIPGALEKTLATGIALGRSDGWHGSLRWRYFGSFPLTEDGSVRGRSTSQLSGRLGYTFRNGVRFSLDGFNLLDREDADVQYFYASRLPASLSPTGRDEPVTGVEDVHFHPVEPRTLRLVVEHSF